MSTLFFIDEGPESSLPDYTILGVKCKSHRSLQRRLRAVSCAVESLETRMLLSSGVQNLFPTRQYNVGADPASIAVADLNGDGRSDIITANLDEDTLTVLLSGTNGVFTSATYTLAGDPWGVAIGDMNGDGKLDLIVATSTPFGGTAANNISILQGNGSGGFGSPVNYALASAPTSLAVADFNGDTHLDVVAGTSTGVTILLNSGSGTLGAPANYLISSGEADQVAVGNIMGHGLPDVVAADEANNTVYVLPDQSSGVLKTAVPYSVGTYIGGIGVADVDGDGKVDVVTSSAVLRGTGTGLSAATQSGLSGGYPLALGDFNGDGNLDVVAISPQNGEEYVQLNSGNASFLPAIHLAAGNSLQQYIAAVAVGDFNGDGKLDAVTADANGGTVSIELGEGTGSLAAIGQQVFVGGDPTAIVAADFNGDGHLDLVTANGQSSGLGNTITVLSGDGSTSFPSFATYTVGNDPRALVVGDFNGDGKADLAVANYVDDTVSILLNLGNGEFASPVNYAVGQGPISIAIGDFNGDGRMDIAVADYDSPEVDLLLNKGAGAFLQAIPYTLNNNPDSVAVGDFNGDGKADIATASYAGQDVEVLTNNGVGGFGPAAVYGVGAGAGSIVAADFNNDGKVDLAVTAASDGVDVLLANSSSGFAPASSIYSGPASELTTGDLNGDSKSDLLIAQANSSYSGSIAVLMGSGNGSFASAVQYSSSTGAQAAVMGDFNGDGKMDVAIATSTYGAGGIAMFQGRGAGVLDAPMLYTATGVDPYAVATGDFNNDGHLDLVTANYQDSTVSVFLNNTHGTLGAPQTYSVGLGPTSVAVGDFNHDGLPDIVAANYLDNTITVLINNGSGFNSPQTIAVGTGPKTLVAGDFNHDGYSDIAVANTFSSSITVLTNNRIGGFGASTINLSNIPSDLAIGDFNHDGYADLAASSVTGNRVFILLNNTVGAFAAPTNFIAAKSLSGPLIVGDLNGDGRTDVVAASYDSSTYSDAITVYLANANGTLGTPVAVDVEDSSVLLLADMNGDGNLDLVMPADPGAKSVAVMLGSGTGTFGTVQTFDVGLDVSALTVGDFDGDGKADLVVGYSAYFGSSLTLAFGNGAGGILSSTSQGFTDSLLSIDSADFNNDGLPDLLTRNVSTTGDTSYSVLLNSNGLFYSSQTFTLPGTPTVEAIGDANGDGKADLVFIEPATSGGNNLLVLLGNGDGTFQTPMIFSAGNGNDPDAVAVGDFNGDGKPDLAVANYGDGTITILLNNGLGGTTVGNTYTVGANPAALVAGDFNSDGKLDLAVANEGSDSISILFATGGGNFAAAQNIPVADAPTQIVAADFNGDSKLDLAIIGNAIGGGSDDELYTLLNLGGGNFDIPVAHLLDSAGTSLAVGDFNGDSSPDLAISSYSNNDVQILLNTRAGAFAAPQDFGVGSAPGKIVTSDFNGDSMSDIAVASYGGVSVLENQFDGIAPQVTANTFTIPTNREQNMTFTVSFTDNFLLDSSSIHTGSVQVTWPDGSISTPTLVSVDSINDKSALATFSLTGPLTEAGTYTLHLIAGGVADSAGNVTAAATVASFTEDTGITVPTAILSPVTLPTSGQTTLQFTVTYEDASSGIDATTLGNNNITVLGPTIGFSAAASLVSYTATATGFAAIYQITAPGGVFSDLSNGTFEILLNGPIVVANDGFYIPGQTLGNFTVDLSQPPILDNVAPTASATGFSAGSTGTSPLVFSVAYTDNIAVNSSSINANTVAIVLPNGTSVHPTILSTSGPGTSITVTYSFLPADGAFDAADNGVYTLNLLAGGFADSSGNLAAASALGSFTFSAQVLPPPDVTAPTATLSSITSPSADQQTVQFTVTYTDNDGGSGIATSTLGGGNITVTGPNFSQQATLISVLSGSDGTQAIYQITAPNGFFTESDNGTYQVNLNSASVSDYSDNFAAARTLGTFDVTLSAPIVAPDVTGAIIAPASAVVPGSKKNSYSFTLANDGSAPLKGKVPVQIYASPTNYYDASTAVSLGQMTEKLKLNQGKSKAFKLKFRAPPAIAGGNYYLIAVVDPGNTLQEQYKSNDIFVSPSTTTFETPAVDLSLNMTPPSKKGVVKLTVTNTSASNVLVKDTVNLSLYDSPDDSTLGPFLSSVTEKISLKVGASKSFSLKLLTPPADGDYLAASMIFNGSPSDNNPDNDTAFSGVPISSN